MITLKLFQEAELSGYTLIEGFPGSGLVGSMTNSYMIDKLQMEYIGYIDSDSFLPVVAIHGNKPMYPVRIYMDSKYKLVLVIAEFTIPVPVMSKLTDEILDFVRKHSISQIISIGGMPSQKLEDKAFAITSDEQMLKKLKTLGIDTVEEGVIAGVSALLLLKAAPLKVPVVDLLVPVNPQIMDPKYAEIAIMNLKKLVNITINTDELEEESKAVQAKVREMLKKAKYSHDELDKAGSEEIGPSMYA